MKILLRKVFIASLVLALIGASVSVYNDPPVQAVENLSSFNDVPQHHWALAEIESMKTKGIITGYDDGTFKPENSIKRQHVALMFARSLELENIREKITFNDVTENHIYIC